MPAAGDYPTRFDWFPRDPAAPNEYGEKVQAPPRDTAPYDKAKASLWGSLESTAGSRGNELLGDRERLTGTIRIRNYPGVAAGDRLRPRGTAQVWTVDAVTYGDDEEICEVSS